MNGKKKQNKYNIPSRQHGNWHRKVVELVKAGYTIEKIAELLDVTPNTVRLSIQRNMYLLSEDVPGIHFGYKNEAYLTEEEMLNGYKPPKYSDLSETEKQLYDEQEEKKRSN